jgi:hypothetical protein
VVLAINTESPTVKQWSNLATMFTPGQRIDVLGWLGKTVALYFDDDPFWADAAKVSSDELNEFAEEHGYRMPVAVRADVKSTLKAAAFLSAVRAFIEQTAPGLTGWESLNYREQPYVKVRPTERADAPEGVDKIAVYYSVVGDGLVVTLNEGVLKRAIDRQLDREKAKAEKKELPPARAWLGENLAAQADRKALDILAAVNRRDYQTQMQALAWSNLAVLNEWKRLFPDRDPLEVHERFWHARLVCPGGGKYAWNEKFQTMESTVYGHPGEPKEGPPVAAQLAALRRGDFGLTFENQGLRARVDLEREKPAAKP